MTPGEYRRKLDAIRDRENRAADAPARDLSQREAKLSLLRRLRLERDTLELEYRRLREMEGRR